MANFQILETSQGISRFDLPLNRSVKLKQGGGDGNGNKLDVVLESPVSGLDLKVLPDSLPAASTAFTLLGSRTNDYEAVAFFAAFFGCCVSNWMPQPLRLDAVWIACISPLRRETSAAWAPSPLTRKIAGQKIISPAVIATASPVAF
jgi:hypothetical protein